MFESTSKIQDSQPRGWFFSQQLAVCTLCKPNQSCPWFQTKSAWCLLASPPPKKSPPPPSPLRIIATKAEKLLLSPHLLLFCLLTCVGGGGGDAFSPAGGGPDGEGGGRWGRNFFWEKLHSRGLRQEQRENYRSTESQSQYEKRSFLP